MVTFTAESDRIHDVIDVIISEELFQLVCVPEPVIIILRVHPFDCECNRWTINEFIIFTYDNRSLAVHDLNTLFVNTNQLIYSIHHTDRAEWHFQYGIVIP